MTTITNAHYICQPSMHKRVAEIIGGSPDLLVGICGRLPNISLSQYGRLLVLAARSSGELRLFHSDGRELSASKMSLERLQEVTGAKPDEAACILDKIKTELQTRLKIRSNLFLFNTSLP